MQDDGRYGGRASSPRARIDAAADRVANSVGVGARFFFFEFAVGCRSSLMRGEVLGERTTWGPREVAE